MAREFLKEF